MPITLQESEVRCCLRLEGEVSIASAAELKQCLVQALATGRELRLNLETATELDITTMQLLWAAQRAAKKSGTEFVVAGTMPAAILAAAHDAGFENFLAAVEPK